MPMLGWPETLPAGTRFRVASVVYKFVERARFTTVGGGAGKVGDPAYEGLCVPASTYGARVKRVVPASDVELR